MPPLLLHSLLTHTTTLLFTLTFSPSSSCNSCFSTLCCSPFPFSLSSSPPNLSKSSPYLPPSCARKAGANSAPLLSAAKLHAHEIMSSEDSLKSLSLDYLNLLINGQAFSDVAFSVEGRLVHAHRCVLAARSLFFRKLFCGLDPNHQPPPPPPPLNWPTTGGGSGGGGRGGAGGGGGASATPELVIPVSSIRYEVLVLVLQFLYSGQASVAAPKSGPLPGCGARGCWHTRCGAAVDLALDTLAAARSFGVEQLALLVQKQLESMVKEASVDDVMKVLMASRKFEMQELWANCSHLVARSGLSADLLAKHLPIDVVAKIEEIRAKSPLTTATTPRSPFLTHHYLPINVASSAADRDNKIRRMRRALDAADIELVKLMVMGEGLDLDDALAVHYAVQHCNRDVVKALLELGAADVNFRAGPTGKTALHLAAEMVSPDMVSVLLDHHADPNSRTLDGVTPLDVLRSLTSEFLFKGAVPGLTHIEPNKLRLCLELVQSAVMVTTRDDGAPGPGGEAGESDGGNFPRSEADDSLVSLTMNSTLMYQGQEMAAAAAVADETRKGNNGRGSPSSAMYFPNGFA